MIRAKTAEPIKVPFGNWDMNVSGPKETYIRWGAYWRKLANMIELFVCRQCGLVSDYFDPLVMCCKWCHFSQHCGQSSEIGNLIQYNVG